jgi:hypothetical protein
LAHVLSGRLVVYQRCASNSKDHAASANDEQR